MGTSLQGRMMLALGLAITLSWALALTAMYVYTAHSQSSRWDSRLQSIGTKILISIPSDASLTDDPGPRLEMKDGVLPQDEEGLVFQVWNNRTTLGARTPDAPHAPLQPGFVDGFANSEIGGVRWRVLSMADRSGQIHVQVAYPWRVINASFRTDALSALGVATALLAVMGLIMWGAVRKSLQPVRSVERSVRRREKFDLTPLPASTLPDEIRPLVDSFNYLMEQLGQAVQGERRFIDDAAHELRTPLSAISAQTEVALQARSIEDKDAALGTLLGMVGRSTRLSEQLLDLARLDAGVHAPRRQWYDLEEIIVHVVGEFEVTAQVRNQTIHVDTGVCRIQCDVDEMGILLRNLVDNALRYTGPGGEVRVRCGFESDHATLRPFLDVADSGPGVDPEEHAAIFERFHRAAGSGSRGAGIGLSLVAKIARLHQADVRTCEGIGAPGFCVRVVFPAVVPQPRDIIKAP